MSKQLSLIHLAVASVCLICTLLRDRFGKFCLLFWNLILKKKTFHPRRCVSWFQIQWPHYRSTLIFVEVARKDHGLLVAFQENAKTTGENAEISMRSHRRNTQLIGASTWITMSFIHQGLHLSQTEANRASFSRNMSEKTKSFREPGKKVTAKEVSWTGLHSTIEHCIIQ